MKRFLPDSLGGWVFTVVLGVVILIHATSLVGYIIFRDESAAATAASQAADHLIVFKRVIEEAGPRERLALIRGLNSPSLRMIITREPLVTDSDAVFTSRIVYRKLEREFPPGTDIRVDSRIEDNADGDGFPSPEEIRRHHRRMLSGRDEVQLAPQNMSPPETAGEGPAEGPLPDAEQRRPRSSFEAERRSIGLDRALRDIRGFQPFVRVSVRVEDTAWFNARIDLNLTESSARSRPFVWLTGITLIIALVALWSVRRATRPVSLFASAAERLGIELNAEPLPETGTGEVRRAARAFNTMQNRLKRFIRDRTQMLAAISHGLRTPITRMRLRAEFVDDEEQRNKMLNDLNEMEAMISATLAFAREDAANEPVESVDVAAMLAGLTGDQSAAGHTASYEGPDGLMLDVRPLGLKRALANLIENAIKYGEGARVMLEDSQEQVTISIDDDGPGIPDDRKEQVFTPFYRLEGSRSRDTGGTGLGLTIARNAVRSMGGDIDLLNRAEGGLRVKVTLPKLG